MAGIDDLAREYERFVAVPWPNGLSPAERVWFALYAPEQERRLRRRLADFEQRTLRANHAWSLVDLTDIFAQWMASHPNRDEYFSAPDFLEEAALESFAETCAAQLAHVLTAPATDAATVVAVHGIASIFGVARVSQIIEKVAPDIRGRLLVFFPGEYADHRYRLLDARDGWNYRATPIIAGEGTAP